VKVTERKPATPKPFDDVRVQVREHLVQDRQQENTRKLVEELQAKVTQLTAERDKLTTDLKAAQSHGLKTAFVPRPTEYGPHQKRDFEATGEFTLVVKDFNDLAARLGC
jgi:hypothetical protein